MVHFLEDRAVINFELQSGIEPMCGLDHEAQVSLLLDVVFVFALDIVFPSVLSK